MATDQTTIFNQGIKQFLRPSTVTSISWSPYRNFTTLPNGYGISSTSGGNPSSNGQLSVDDTNPTNVAFIEVYDNSGNGANNGAFLNSIVRGSQIRIQQFSTGQDIYYDVLFVNDMGSYVQYQVIYDGGYAGGSFNTASTINTYFYSDYEYELNHGYNLLTVTNTSTSNPQENNFRMRMPSNMEAGEELIVEILAGSGTTNNVIPSYIYCLNNPSGTSISDFSDEYTIFVPNGTSTNALLTLDSNDRAIMKFLSWYNSSTQNGLILLGAQQVING